MRASVRDGMTRHFRRAHMLGSLPVFRGVALLLIAASPLAAQEAEKGKASITAVAPQLYVVSTRTGNLVVRIGSTETIVVGLQDPILVAAARTMLGRIGAPPVRFAVLMVGDSSRTYGDGGWSTTGAITFAHENARFDRKPNMAHPLPTVGFSEVVQIHLPEEDVHVVHQAGGYSKADAIAHFERANVVCLGNTFTADDYPTIDATWGGTVAGLIKSVEFFVKYLPENTRFVPGRGRVSSMEDLRGYLRMLVAVRDRVARLVATGATEREAVAARPTAEFDSAWGKGPVTPAQFVAAVFTSLATPTH